MKKVSQKKMFIIGAYGCGNRGDDAILQGICALFPEWDICVTNGSYSDVSRYLPVRTVLCRLNEGFSLSVLASMAKNSLKMMARIFKSDVLLFGGGSLIHDLRLYNLPYMFFWQQWAKLCGKKVFYFSTGVGPLNTQRGQRLCRHFLERADGVFVRDQRGYELCRHLGLKNVRLTADAAFYITQKNQCEQQTLHLMNVKKKQYCCVTASQWFKSSNFWGKDNLDFSKQIKDFAAYIRVVAEKYKQPIIFVPTVMHDASLGEKLKIHLSDIDFRIAPANWNSKEMAEILENASFLLGVRMHSIILAARQQVPFLALIYDEKVSQLLMRLGLEALSAPLDDSTTPETIERLVDYVLEHQEEIQEKLKQKTEELHSLVCSSKDIIEEAYTVSKAAGL